MHTMTKLLDGITEKNILFIICILTWKNIYK